MASNESFPILSFPSMQPQRSEGSACGKAILVGEHAVVYGARAVALPLKDLRLKIYLWPFEREHKGPETLVTKRVDEVILEAKKLLGLNPFSYSITGQSKLPIGAGVGSSAALCVAVLRTLSDSLGIEFSSHELAVLGNQLERRFHGHPSGLDAATVAYEEVILFQKDPHEITEVVPKGPYYFALIDSGIRASTKTMIHMAAPYFKGAQGEQRIARFDQLSENARLALEAGNTLGLRDQIDACGHYLQEAGVVTPSLQSMIQDIRNKGALAAKTTGAGGGGVILALLDPEHGGAQLSELKKAYGADSVYGVQI